MKLTKEQIAEALQSDEVKEAIKAAVETEVTGLKSKRDELLASVRDLKDKMKEIQDERDEAAAKAAEKSGNVEEIKKQLETKHAKELEKRDATISKLSGQLEKHVIGEGLTKALTKAKISPDHIDAVTALIKTSFKAEVGDNDGQPFAKFDGKNVDEFVTAWAQTDVGKRYVVADNNSGGGSNGANGSGKAGNGTTNGKTTMTRPAFEALPPAKKSEVARAGVVLTD